MLRANQEFDATSDAEEYEKRVARLLRLACRRDKKTPGGSGLWREALNREPCPSTRPSKIEGSLRAPRAKSRGEP
jgi:hypothetical protein